MKNTNDTVIEALISNGVKFICTDGVVISRESVIEPGVVIYPNTIIEGAVKIGAGSVIGPGAFISDCEIGADVRVNASQCYGSKIGNGSKIGPNAHIRPGCQIGENIKIGAFVEVKNSKIGNGSSMAHLCYVGDADVGERVNFGCGTITANYDGISKYRTVIGDGAFIGCNSNLIAPAVVGKDAYIAAGSNVRGEVEAGALAIGRVDAKIKSGWADKFFKNRKSE